jgi:spore coat polysaccharide biosynthesis predicted glycosyltransferase SpsG/CMP-N-acetylneuraminic acid synthetase
MNESCIIIPAVKKNVAFTDDLVKKIAGISLIQRAIDKAKALTDIRDIYVVTDSEEIRLICERSDVKFHYDQGLRLNDSELFSSMKFFVLKIVKKYENVILLSPYAPLFSGEDLKKAFRRFKAEDIEFFLPVKRKQYRIFKKSNHTSLQRLLVDDHGEDIFIESRAFQIFKSNLVLSNTAESLKPTAYELGSDFHEITSFHDWWICEKLLKRKRIVFRVIGNEKVGMGHIYRALSLAHEITDHEIMFVCDTLNMVAVNKIAGYNYWLGIYEPEDVVSQIIKLQPDLVINDILSTTEEDVAPLLDKGIKVVNFEDLGEGARLTDLTINELYDKPQIDGDNIVWGHKYFFVRDEFSDAQPHAFIENVDNVLLTFGGTDQHSLSLRVYRIIKKLCRQRNIRVNIVTGAGYKEFDKLEQEIKKDPLATLTRATGVISGIMEKSQVAVVSNGRTVYELAHLNIPAIVIPQHTREKTHDFACEENGFMLVELSNNENLFETNILAVLTKLLDDTAYRRKLFDRLCPFRFDTNKQYVLKKILALIENTTESTN